MKRYIIMTYDIHPLGGCQNYLSGKCPYLEKRGWEVYVLFTGVKNGKFEFRNLSAYADGNVPELDFIPAELTTLHCRNVIEKMMTIVSKPDTSYTESVIESHYDKMHLWGELLAERIGAKHMCFNCNEIFRGKDKYFESYLDFYKFKYERKELYGIVEQSMFHLFEGYNNVELNNKKNFNARTPDAVQDVPCPELDNFPNATWNVCYFGRILKSYVDRILSDVALFAKSYPDKLINFVIIGDEKPKEAQVHEIFDRMKNVNLILMGNRVPVPRDLVRKMDVIIAGSGCACSVVNEDVPVVVPDPDACLSNGLMGYENESSILLDEGRERESFDVTLRRVLVENVCSKIQRKYVYNFASSTAHYNEHMEMIADSVQIKEYYPSEALTKSQISFVRKMHVYYELLRRKLA